MSWLPLGFIVLLDGGLDGLYIKVELGDELFGTFNGLFGRMRAEDHWFMGEFHCLLEKVK